VLQTLLVVFAIGLGRTLVLSMAGKERAARMSGRMQR